MNELRSEPQKETAAYIITIQAEKLACRAAETLERMEDCLVPVMVNATPETVTEKKDGMEMPPLFSSLRQKMNLTGEVFDCINALLDRVEL